MAHGTRVHERVEDGGDAVTITLPVPTSYAVEPARLVAWLGSHGWIECDEPGYLSKRGQDPIWIPLDVRGADLREAIEHAADAEGMQPHALAALLATPAPQPALQWAHMSDAARAAALNDIEGMATILREGAARQRTFGRAEAALVAEGRAMGLEAAAAVLRGGGR